MEEVSAEGNRPERTDDDYGHIDGKNHSKTPEEDCSCPIWVGGAVLTEDIANSIGADYYAEDAMASVALLEKLI